MRQARERIIPVLQEILRQEHEAELCDSATLALARVAAMDHARTLPADISRGLRHETLSVKTSATLSLGVLGDARALPLLNSLMTDSSSGRNAIGDSRVPWQIRAYAALSLGLINDQLAIEPLIDSVLDTSVQDRELRVAAVSALGLMDNEARQSAVAGLLAIIKQRDMDPVVQAHAITSIGHLGDRAALPCLLDLYREPDTDDCVLQSVAIAFGRLGMATDSDVIKALTDAIEDESDASCRQFGLIALARIGMSQDPANVASADPEIGRLLRRQVSHPTHRADRGWAALGTALHARSAPASERQLAVDVLSDEYEDTRDPSVRAALALALGLVDASSMAPTLLDDLLDSRDDAYRGYAAVGLGLLKYKPAAGAIVSMCTDSAASDTVRLQAARALGLMRDPDLAPVLVKALSETASLDLAWSLGRALGQLRDPASVDPLIQLIEDNHRSVLARAFSCVAIGLIGEKRDLRFNTAIQEDYNYAAPVAVLNEVVNL